MAGIIEGLLGIPSYFGTVVNLLAVLIIVLLASRFTDDKRVTLAVGILAALIVFGVIEIPM